MKQPGHHSAPILVVDDDRDIREAIADTLRDEGYAVDLAGNGSEALTWLQTHPPPCLVLLDLMMPGMSGQDLFVALQGEPRLAETRLAIISAARDVREQAQDMKAVGWLQKPLAVQRLLELVSQHC